MYAIRSYYATTRAAESSVEITFMVVSRGMSGLCILIHTTPNTQQQFKPGSPGAASAGDQALMLLDKAVHDTQAESLMSVAFRAFQGMEEMTQNLRGNAGTVVDDADLDIQGTVPVHVAIVDDP